MKKRDTNLELLRIISMMMIIVLHLLNFGGFLFRYDNMYVTILVWLLESLCFVAVNCYVLISGYFLVNSEFKLNKLFKIVLEVIFYSLLIYLSLIFFKKDLFDIRSFLKCFLPIFFGKYWFVSCYVILYILSPFINKLINNLSKNEYKHLLIILFIFFSCWSCIIPNGNTINYGGSYSISWFIILYLFAGYIRLYLNIKDIKIYKFIISYLLCSIINVLCYIIIPPNSFIVSDFLYNYYSITVLIGSICLFICMMKLKINNKLLNKIILFFSPTTFGIYLIHENPSIRTILWNRFNYYNIIHYSWGGKILYVIIVPFIVFISFSIIDKLRIIMFNYLYKTKLYIRIENKLRGVKL